MSESSNGSSNKTNHNHDKLSPQTKVLHAGRNPEKQHGFVNSSIYRGSTVLFPTVESLQTNNQAYTYGRKGTPTVRNLEHAIANLEGGDKCFLTSSGLSAVTTAIMSFAKAGDHILVTDSVYQPTRSFCDKILTDLNIETTYYAPRIGANIANLIKENTKLIFTESPGSQTFEIQDTPAISRVAKEKNIWILLDNTWATPLYFKPFEHGVDVSIQAATKYIIGHADALLGSVTATEQAAPHVQNFYHAFGLCPGPEDVYLGLRGLRTLDVRLERHWQSGLKIAQWLKNRPEVDQILHPAMETHPDHHLWKRDFLGSAGLFSIILNPFSDTAIANMLESLELFGMGWSWGGFESLAIPFNPSSYRTATEWNAKGPAIRFHIGLDNVDDLIADLEQGFQKLHQTND